MKKSILVITQYFWPEKFHINDVCQELKNLGHSIQVMTGKPNYPKGRIFKGYKKKLSCFEKYKNIDIYRIPLTPRGNSSNYELLKNYFSFIFNGLLYGARFKYKKFDIILFYGTSPITSAIPAILLKLIYKKKLIIWVQDLWPQSVVATGHIKNLIILKIINLIVMGIYTFSDKILIQSKSFKDYILNQTSKKKIIFHPNSFKIPTSKIGLQLKHKKLFKGNTCITFAGNIGKAQNLETLLLAAKKLKKLTKLKFLIIGNGSDKIRLLKIVKSQNIDNVYFLGNQSQEYVYEIYKKSRAVYVSLKNNEVLNLTLPYKMQSYLSAGKLIIGSISGITKRIIINNKLGFCCNNGDVQNLERIFLKVYSLKNKQIKIIETNSKNYFKKNFDFKKTIKKLSNIIDA